MSALDHDEGARAVQAVVVDIPGLAVVSGEGDAEHADVDVVVRVGQGLADLAVMSTHRDLGNRFLGVHRVYEDGSHGEGSFGIMREGIIKHIASQRKGGMI